MGERFTAHTERDEPIDNHEEGELYFNYPSQRDRIEKHTSILTMNRNDTARKARGDHEI